MLTDKGKIGPSQHLIITYQNQLDSGTQNGLQLTNVAGATEWFSADSSNTGNTRTVPARLEPNSTGRTALSFRAAFFETSYSPKHAAESAARIHQDMSLYAVCVSNASRHACCTGPCPRPSPGA